jgi:hypothetical protein
MPPAQAEPTALTAARGDGATADWLHDVWQRVMRDLNTQHKRIHAILRNADPLRIDGETLVLVAAYEFHYKQINQEATRTLIEEALARQAGQRYRVRCVQAGDGDGPSRGAEPGVPPAGPVTAPEASQSPPGAPLPSSTASPTSGPAAAPGGTSSDPSDDQARLQAAINIFNARLV